MNLIKNITPKDTEEIKPGLFVQKKGDSYRQIYPAAWNGKIIWNNFLWGGKPLQTLFLLAIILFLAWSYSHDVEAYKIFYEEVKSDPVSYCIKINEMISSQNTLQLNFGKLDGDTYSLPNNN